MLMQLVDTITDIGRRDADQESGAPRYGESVALPTVLTSSRDDRDIYFRRHQELPTSTLLIELQE